MGNLRKQLILAALALVVLVAVVATVTLGNPLGRAIGRDAFPLHAEHGAASVDSATEADLPALATYADAWLASVQRWTGVAARPVSIRLFRDQRTFNDLGAQALPGFAKGMDWCYDPSAGIIYGWVMSPDDMQHRLRHELFHHAAREFGPLPPWLEEGTCEMLEKCSLASDGSIVLDAVQRERLMRAARTLGSGADKLVSTMVALDRNGYRGKDRDTWYSLGYAAAVWLLRDGHLGDLIRARGVPAAQTLATPAPFVAFTREPSNWKSVVGLRLDVAPAGAGKAGRKPGSAPVESIPGAQAGSASWERRL